jgi:hypothetical protein
MSDTPLMAMINAATERFETRPEYRASDATRAELQTLDSPSTTRTRTSQAAS